MFSWDVVLTSLIVTAAAVYVSYSSYKTISGATNGCSGCCSACSHCNLGGENHESIGDKMAQAIARAKQ
jgi:hypothetical protein